VAGIIEYFCSNPAHRPTRDADAPLLVYDGGAGYCPAGDVGGHEWCATGGRTLATVREWLARPAAAPFAPTPSAAPSASRAPSP
jgi:hypothetical protein